MMLIGFAGLGFAGYRRARLAVQRSAIAANHFIRQGERELCLLA